ncbi:MAG: FTR1 family iron permease, partial [Solirubrobacterales bacterium]
ALAIPASAAAEDGSIESAKRENDEARALVDQAVDASESGDRERGYELARTAYLDHFEKVEIPLRLRDPNLVLDLEFEFAKLRDGIRGGEPIGEIKETEGAVRAGLDDVERELSDPGVAAPAVALGFSFSILFREGLEAVLLIAVLLGSLEAARASSYRRPLAWGAAAAVGATAVTFVLAATLLDIAPVDRELLEAGTALLAVLVLFAVTFWLVSRLEQRRWMEFMRSRTAAAVAAGGALAFAGLGFTAVYREGFETVLFYQALILYADGLLLWVGLGAAAAAAALVGLAYAVFALGRKLPLRAMLIAGASILLLLSVAFAGNAVRSLQEADVVVATPIEGDWARLPIFIAEMTGIHPTREGIAVQAALLAVYAVGALYVFWLRPARRRRMAPGEAEQAGAEERPAREGAAG